jgi:hypothetical protein
MITEVLYPKLNSNYGNLRVALPPINFWIDKIKNKKHFHFVKVNHGFFDHLTRAIELKHIKGIKLSSAQFPKDPIEAANLMYQIPHRYHESVPLSVYEKAVEALYDDLRNRDNRNVFVGVSDSNGIAWAKKRGRKGFRKTYNALMSIIKETDRPYLHGGLFRQYTVANELGPFIKELNKPENNVIIVGPDYCKGYQKGLGKFHHVEIPHTNALNEIEQIVKKCYDKVDPNKHNIILASCALISFILGKRFRSKDKCHHTYIDVGRSFDYLIKERLNQPWLNDVTHKEWLHEIKKIRNTQVKIKTEKL